MSKDTSMHARTRRGNRFGIGLVGAVLLLLGAAVVLIATRVIPVRSSATVFPDPIGAWVSGHRWSWWVLVGIAAVIALLALRWLLVQLRVDRSSRVVIDRESAGDALALGSGRTDLRAVALRRVVAEEVEALPGVVSAKVVVSGTPDRPALQLAVTTTAAADVGTLQRQVVGQVLDDVRTSLDLVALDTRVTFDVGTRQAARAVA